MKKVISNVKFRLYSIDYKAVEGAEGIKTLNIKTKDSYDIIENKNDYISILFSRSVSFEPKVLYELNIKFEVVFNLIEDDNGKEYTEEYIEKNISDLYEYSNMPHFVVNLIADISSSTSNAPIITTLAYAKEE